MITDLNVFCHLFRLNSIQSTPSSTRRVLCLTSFRACELMNLAMSCAYVHSSPSGCVLRVTDIPKRRKISHNFSPCSNGTISLSWEWESNTGVASADSGGKGSQGNSKKSRSFFARELVGAEPSKMASAMARISFSNGSQPQRPMNPPSLVPPANRRRIAVAHPWLWPPRKIRSSGTLSDSSLISSRILLMLVIKPRACKSLRLSGSRKFHILNHWGIGSSNLAGSPSFALTNIHLMVGYISLRLRWPTFGWEKKFEQNVSPLLPSSWSRMTVWVCSFNGELWTHDVVAMIRGWQLMKWQQEKIFLQGLKLLNGEVKPGENEVAARVQERGDPYC